MVDDDLWETEPKEPRRRRRPTPDQTVFECLDAWLASEPVSAETAKKYRTVIRRFAEHVANARVEDISKAQVAGFLERVAQLPSATSVRGNFTMSELMAMRDRWLWEKPKGTPASNWPLVSTRTANRHLEVVKSMLAAVARHHDDFVNVARDVKRIK